MPRTERVPRQRLSRRLNPDGFTLVELLVVMTILMILSGMILTAVFTFKRHMTKKAAGVDIQTFTMGLAAYRKEFGAYPPDDVMLTGSVDGKSATDEFGKNEVIYYYLGRKHRRGANFYGPYVKLKEKRLRDVDDDGHKEYLDTFLGLYEYHLVLDSSGAVLGYNIVSPGPDGVMESASDPSSIDYEASGDDITQRSK